MPVDVPEMRDTRQRYVHTIAGGQRDAQPLGVLCSDGLSCLSSVHLSVHQSAPCRAPPKLPSQQQLTSNCMPCTQTLSRLSKFRERVRFLSVPSDLKNRPPGAVLVPGYGAGAAFYFRNLADLSLRFRTYAIDMLGTGMSGSDALRTYSNFPRSCTAFAFPATPVHGCMQHCLHQRASASSPASVIPVQLVADGRVSGQTMHHGAHVEMRTGRAAALDGAQSVGG